MPEDLAGRDYKHVPMQDLTGGKINAMQQRN